ncbi:hypothetical protein H1Q59_08520 [Holosporaceae bacterium 'Namur']|nr:hypothetical protein [Holosporaceae bacterium 'Namur']
MEAIETLKQEEVNRMLGINKKYLLYIIIFAFVLYACYESIYSLVVGFDIRHLPYSFSDMISPTLGFAVAIIGAFHLNRFIEYITIKSNQSKVVKYAIKYWPLFLIAIYALYPKFINEVVLNIPAILVFISYWGLSAAFSEFKRGNKASFIRSEEANLFATCLLMILAVTIYAYTNATIDRKGLRVSKSEIIIGEIGNNRVVRIFEKGVLLADKKTNKLKYERFQKRK